MEATDVAVATAPAEGTAPVADGQSTVATEDQVGPAEGDPTPEAVIAKAEAVVVVPPTEEELIAKKDAVFAYERNHKIVPQVFSKRTSSRPLCAGCAFGIRQETKPKYMDGFPYHPNCFKAAQDATFAIKLSPRYLAAAVPVMTKVALAKYNESPAEAEEGTDGEEVLEDATTDLVQEAVKKGRGKKSA